MRNEVLFLCFNNDKQISYDDQTKDLKTCRASSGPLEAFSEIALSIDTHEAIHISSSDSKSKICLKSIYTVGSLYTALYERLIIAKMCVI